MMLTSSHSALTCNNFALSSNMHAGELLSVVSWAPTASRPAVSWETLASPRFLVSDWPCQRNPSRIQSILLKIDEFSTMARRICSGMVLRTCQTSTSFTPFRHPARQVVNFLSIRSTSAWRVGDGIYRTDSGSPRYGMGKLVMGQDRPSPMA